MVFGTHDSILLDTSYMEAVLEAKVSYPRASS